MAQVKVDHLHDRIIAFWDVASHGDLNELRIHSSIVRQECEKHPAHSHSSDFIRLVNAIEFFFESNCEKAEQNFLSVLPPLLNWENKEIEAMARLFCGGNYRSLGQYDKALSHLLEVPRLLNPDGSYARFALLAYYFLGEIHVSLGELKAAENYYISGLDFGEQIEESDKFRLYSGLGNLYLSLRDLIKGESYLKSAVNAARQGSQLARSWHDLAVFYEISGDLDAAIEYCTKSYQLRIKCNLTDAASTSQILKGKLLMKKGELRNAIDIFENTLESTIKFNAIVKTQSIYKLLSECYEKTADWHAAYENFKKYEDIKSTIFSEQQTKFFKIKNEEISKQKEVIEKFHGELKSSIKYARRIQQALMPHDKILTDIFPYSFLFYKPKDVVSGDFYWIETFPQDEKKDPIILFAVADCTGHGVPGAMVSIICVNALNRSVREFGFTEPAKILNKTREIVIEAFEKSELDLKDGMDISLCSYDPNTQVLQWAGANNPLFIIPKNQKADQYLKTGIRLFPEDRADNVKLIEVIPDKQPIGRHFEEIPFTNHLFQIEEGDQIYLFSDGFVDQFGGPHGKKFKNKFFKENLLTITQQPSSIQHQSLNDIFYRWKGNYEQVDDVCVMGVRIH